MSALDPETIFTAWAVRKERGEDPDFEAVLREHPEHADALHRLHRDWALFAPLLSRVVPGLLAGEIPDSPLDDGEHAHETLADVDEPFVEALGLRMPLGARYRFRAVVGRGGGGVVLKVWDAKLGRDLAMKVVLGREVPHESDGPRFERRVLGRFVSEARIAGRLDHPGIVPVHELGADETGRAFFTMKLVEGRTLTEVLRAARERSPEWSTTRVVGVLLKVCDAMAYAHERRVLHRDLKPSNVMIGSFGEVYVMDWGLARIVGRTDSRDLRIRPAATTSSAGGAQQPRAREAADVPESVVTLDGAVLGTPAYMSPEQARGEIEALGPATDVYAIGAMLYELLAEHPPFLAPSTPRSAYDVLASVIAGSEDPLDVPALRSADELASICARAMAREASARYATMRALGDDLRAYLEGRSVAAHPTGAWRRFWKWTKRNRAVAVSAFVAVASGATGLVLLLGHWSLQHEFALASAVADLQRLRAEAAALWPLAPSELPRMRSWMRESLELRELSALPSSERAELQRRLDELRSRARPWSAQERARDRAVHPELRQLEHLQRQEEVLRANLLSRARGVALDRPPPSILEGEPGIPAAPARRLALAKLWISPERTVYGRELQGWALVESALERSDDSLLWRAQYVAAQSAIVNGHDAAARAHLSRARELAPEIMRDGLDGLLVYTERLLGELGPAGTPDDANPLLAQLTNRRVQLETIVDVRRTFTFDSATDARVHDGLRTALNGPEFLFDETTGVVAGSHPDGGWSVEARIESLERSERRLREDPEFIARWNVARAELHEHVAPDGPGTEVVPRGDLMPLGRDPSSGLYEFGFLPSGTLPRRGTDGRWSVEVETCIVFVLLPGGTVWLGSQREDPAGTNFDPYAEPDAPPIVAVTLDPYLVSKYELTQRQWWTLSGTAPSYHIAALADRFSTPDERHPVEQVSATAARAVLERFGMDLPTEAQWERAARADTRTAWYVGDDARALAGHANLADRHLAGHGGRGEHAYETWLDDGHAITARVGSFAPNAFGLHDVCGNVAELTRDDFDSFGREFHRGDGEWRGANDGNVAARGGSMLDLAVDARSARRVRMHRDDRDPAVGVRPCLVDPWKRGL